MVPVKSWPEDVLMNSVIEESDNDEEMYFHQGPAPDPILGHHEETQEERERPAKRTKKTTSERATKQLYQSESI